MKFIRLAAGAPKICPYLATSRASGVHDFLVGRSWYFSKIETLRISYRIKVELDKSVDYKL